MTPRALSLVQSHFRSLGFRVLVAKVMLVCRFHGIFFGLDISSSIPSFPKPQPALERT